MPRNVLRQFTGGISNEINPQNLRDDQGEEAVDINLKGLALEPGDGLAELTDAGHYHYRGEWIRDSKAVSFEESGIGVIKTYDTKRPEFEEIINDEPNEQRDLGPPLPPRTAISGSIVSEGSRGLRPADGAHLLEIGSDKFGVTDTGTSTLTPPYKDAPSLKEYNANVTSNADDIYFYDGKPYWIENWQVTTGETGSHVLSGVLSNYSQGTLFKENYFICWDGQRIQTVPLSTSSMTIDTFNTIDPNDGGDAGQSLAAGTISGANTGATGNTISGVDICNGIITFSQAITTDGMTVTEYTDSDKERWIVPSKHDSILFFLRDGTTIHTDHPLYDSDGGGAAAGEHAGAGSSGAWDAGDDEFEVSCQGIAGAVTVRTVGQPEWIIPTESWTEPTQGTAIPYGLKYFAIGVKKNTWSRVRFIGANRPQIYQVVGEMKERRTTVRMAAGTSLPAGKKRWRDLHYATIDSIYVTRTFSSRFIGKAGNREKGGSEGLIRYYTVEPKIKIVIPYWQASITYIQNNVYTSPSAPGVGAYNYRRHISSQKYKDGRWTGGYIGKIIFAPAMGSYWWDWFKLGVPIGLPSLSSPNLTISGWVKTESSSFNNGRKYSHNLLTNDTSGTEKGYINRLCSFVPGSSLTLQKKFGYSQLWTQATITKESEGVGSITFPAANDTLFTVGDYIKVRSRRTSHSSGRTLSWNAFLKSESGGRWKGSRWIVENKITASTALSSYLTAKILEINNTDTKIKFEIMSRTEKGGKKLQKFNSEKVKSFGSTEIYQGPVDEKCYPIITTITPFKEDQSDSLAGPQRKVIQTDLLNHVLIGNHLFDFPTTQKIEVRGNDGAALESNEQDYNHNIDWEVREYETPNKRVVTGWGNLDIRAITASSGPRIFYKSLKAKKLLSQDGGERSVSPRAITISNAAIYYLTSTLLSVVDGGKVTVYNPTYDVQYLHGNPELQKGLGIIGTVQDVIHFVNSYGTQVFIKMANKWKIIRTSSTKTVAGVYSETSLLNYNFLKPLYYDGIDKAWGIHGSSSAGYNIHTSVPFFESDLRGSWIYYADSGNTKSAWGRVMKIRLGVADSSGKIPRYISIDWKFDSGTYPGAGGTLAIGFNHEAGKLLGDQNEFIWYPLDSPTQFLNSTTNQASTIGDLFNGTWDTTLGKIKIKFKSRVTRDVVFFKHDETVLPSSGQTGADNRINFLNYEVGTQNFYVLNDKAIILHGTNPKEEGYMLSQAEAISGATVAFDASRVGISSFLVGAPNMFNAFGPNIDFYYRASFIDKWNHESAPSPLPTKGIAPLDSPDDCVQINLDENFFHFDNTYIKKIRMYRYGGDSSEFMFLRDIEMPDLTKFPLELTGLSGDFSRPTATSQYYELKTKNDISKLSKFTDTNFALLATVSGGGGVNASDLDGSWNINQISENDSPTAVISSTLDGELNETDDTITITSVSGFPVPTAVTDPYVVQVGEEYIQYTGISGSNLTGCTRGYYSENDSSRHEDNVTIKLVQWILEIQHRNQDTSTLETAIDTPIGSTGTNIYIKNSLLFQDASSGSPKQILIGNEIYDYTGKDVSTDPNILTGATHNTGGSLPTTHESGVTVFSYEENFSSVTTVTNMSIEITSFGYRDKSRTPVASLHYMQEDNYPPLGLKYNEDLKGFYETENQDDYFRYIKAVGSMYFAGLDANLKFSRYGTPEYWPLDAVVTLDSEIRAIREHAGEGLVWTTNSLYRVRGTDPKAMVAFRVPDAHGIKAGDEHTVAETYGGVLWLTANDGIAMYQSGRVTYLTRDKHLITNLIKPFACVSEGVYWLFQRPGSGNGFRLEISGGDLRLCQTTIEAYYAHYAKTLGKAVVVVNDDELSNTDTEFNVSEIGGARASDILWRSKKIDTGEPAIAKALGSLAIVYEALDSTFANTDSNGIRGQALAASLLSLDTSDLDAGDLNESGLDATTDLYDIFTKYDQQNQIYEIDIDGKVLTEDERKTVAMPLEFDIDTVSVGDVIWNEMFDDNTTVESVGTVALDVGSRVSLGHFAGLTDWVFTEPTSSLVNGDLIHFNANTFPGNITADTDYYAANVYTANAIHHIRIETEANKGTGTYVPYSTPIPSGLTYVKKIYTPAIVLDKEPLRSGSGVIYWGNLPIVDIFINNETIPARSFVLPPTDSIESQSVDLYLNDLRRFRTISIQIRGNVRVQTVSLRHYPLQNYQLQTLHHSADIFYKGDIDFRVMLDGILIYRQELENAGDEFTEERIYLPASSYGQRVHYMNESKNGTIESVTFNGNIAA